MPFATYVVGYLAPNGHYSTSPGMFAIAGFANPPLSALANTTSANGVYAHSASSVFPSSTSEGTNYWVDVDFEPAVVPGEVTDVTARSGEASATVTWSAPSSGGPVTDYTITPHAGTTALPPTSLTGSPPATSATIGGLTDGVSYTFTVQAANPNGAGPVSSQSNAVIPGNVMAPPAMDANVSVNGRGTLTTGAFSTSEAGRRCSRWSAPTVPLGLLANP